MITAVEWHNNGKVVRGTAHIPAKGGSPWLIFCHGFTGHRMGPGYFYVAISRHCEREGIGSLRFDFTGSGESDGSFAEMTVSTMRQDLLSAVSFVRKHYAPSVLLFFGHSLGATVAAKAAAEAGADGLVFVAPVANPMDHVSHYTHILKGVDGRYELGPHEMSIAFLEDLKGADPFRPLGEGFTGGMLIFQGGRDETVRADEVRTYVSWAHQWGIDVRYQEIAEADHRFSTVESRLQVCTTIVRWIRERYARE